MILARADIGSAIPSWSVDRWTGVDVTIYTDPNPGLIGWAGPLAIGDYIVDAVHVWEVTDLTDNGAGNYTLELLQKDGTPDSGNIPQLSTTQRAASTPVNGAIAAHPSEAYVNVTVIHRANAYNVETGLFGAGGAGLSGIPVSYSTAGPHSVVKDNVVFCDTTANTVTLTLPGSPSVGDTLRIVDATNTSAVNNIIVQRNGNNIGTLNEDLNIDINGSETDLVYYGSSYGWLVIYHNNTEALPGLGEVTGGTFIGLDDTPASYLTYAGYLLAVDPTEGDVEFVEPSVVVADNLSALLGAPNGIATLDANSLIPATQIPPLAMTNVHAVADITARDALVGTPEETTITPIDASLMTSGQSFTINGITGAYQVWYNIDGIGLAPTPVGDETLIEVAIAGTDVASSIASATQIVLDAMNEFSVVDNTGSFTVTNTSGGNVIDAADVDTGFTIVVDVQGVPGTAVPVIQEGDVAVVSGTSQSFIWNGTAWLELLTPGGGDQSTNTTDSPTFAGLTITGLGGTDNSVIFANNAGVLSEDGANFYYNDITGELTAVSFNATSTAMAKTNIEPMNSQLIFDKVMQLQGVAFDYIRDGKASLGLLAEDVDKIFPEFVGHNKQGQATGIDYGKLTSVLVEALKVQQAKIDELYSLIGHKENK